MKATIRRVQAFKWYCHTCHETGIALDARKAETALAEHQEDYH